MKHLSTEAVRLLIQTAEGDRNKLLFTLLFEHGLRVSESLALTKASMQRGGYLRVKARKKGKNADEQVNPQTLALWDKVTEHILPGTLVFPFSRQWADTLFHRYCDAAKIQLRPRMGVHSLRHSLGHAMLDSGASLPECQKALRHRSLSSTSCYLEADADDVDFARSKAIHAATVPAPALSLAAIRAEIQRLSELAAAMQAEMATATA
jgi:integrase/recombinase XerD